MTSLEPPQSDLLDRFARTFGPIVIAAATVVMAAWTWLKWPDPIVDFGRELYVPWQITQGKVLYRDLAYFNGPLSPHLNAFVFKLLGVSLRSLVMANLVVFIAIVAMVFWLWTLLADRLTALLASLTLVTVFGFIQLSGIGNYNYLTPYSHELTHGLALSLGAILCVATYARSGPSQRSGRSGWIAGAGLLLGMVFLTKAEVFVASSVAVTLGVLLAARAGGASRSRTVSLLAQYGFSILVAPIVAFVALGLVMPWSESFRGTCGAWTYIIGSGVTRMYFYRKILGTSDVANNVYQMLQSLIWITGIIGTIAAIATTIRRPRRRGVAGVSALLATAIGLWALQKWVPINWDRAFSGISLITLAIAVGIIVAVFRNLRTLSPRLIVQFMLASFALLLLGKMFFNALLYHYGFVLAMPATLLIIALLSNWWPGFIERRGGAGVVLRAASIAIVAFVIFIHLQFYVYLGAEKPTLVGSGKDAFWGDLRVRDIAGDVTLTDRRGTAVNLMLDALTRLSPNATLATVPEGTMLNYLSRRANSTPYFNLMPPEVLMFGQDRILRAFTANPPDYVVLVLRSDPRTFGTRPFDIGYGSEIHGWIKDNYQQVPAAVEETYPMLLLRRK